MKYGGILGTLAEAVDIRAEQGVRIDEAFQIQRERDERRRQERDEAQNIFWTQDPREIAARVGLQMGISTEEAIDQMVAFDIEALCNFHIGNDIDRKELN